MSKEVVNSEVDYDESENDSTENSSCSCDSDGESKENTVDENDDLETDGLCGLCSSDDSNSGIFKTFSNILSHLFVFSNITPWRKTDLTGL